MTNTFDLSKSVAVSELEPFARGGNRLCFVHPDYPSLCIKIRRPDFPLEELRRKKGFPKSLKPLIFFDDNREEYLVLQRIAQRWGDRGFAHISRCYGYIPTDSGRGLVLELIKDADQRISRSLKQHLWEEGRSPSFERAFDEFCDYWAAEAIPSRNLLLHNIVAQRDKHSDVTRLVVIDGLGNQGLVPEKLLPSYYWRRKALRKIELLRHHLEIYWQECQQGKTPSHVGRLLHDGSTPQQ